MTIVNYFHSNMPGAPTLTSAISSMINLLSACLVDGFGSGTIDSLIVVDGIATATRAAGNSFEVDTVVEISGATPSGLNGRHRVLTASATQITFATAEANVTATGTISQKLAPLGWTKPFTDTNVAVFRNDPIDGTGMYLRVSDTAVSGDAVVRGYETMTDANTGTGEFPTSIQLPNGICWGKAEDGSAKPWVIVGDIRGFYMWVSPLTIAGYWVTVKYFGDYKSITLPSDSYAAVITGTTATLSYSYDSLSNTLGYVNGQYHTIYVARTALGVGGAQTIMPGFHSISNYNIRHSGDNAAGSRSYPNPGDNGLYLSNLTLTDSLGYRGYLPGLYCTFQSLISSVTLLDKFTGIPDLPDRKLLVLKGNGVLFVDITGPWW